MSKNKKETKAKAKVKKEVTAPAAPVESIEAPEAQSQEQVAEQPAEDKPAESQSEQPVESELPEYTKPTYVASSILVAKPIDDLDSDIESDETVRVNTLKDFVECYPTARFTKIAKTKAIVTAEPEQMLRLTENHKRTFKRTIMVTAL
ncbi:MAG: hypothetical protein IJM04_04530 [Prevotella sp.]|nr:hypothetical protein [Prevotella sp.]